MTRIRSNIEIWNEALAEVPPAAKACLRKSIDFANPPPFCEAVLTTIEADAAAGRPGPLSALLLSGVVSAAIADPELLTLEDALRLAREASRLDPGLDYKILAHVTRSSRDWPSEVPHAEIMRALAVIDEISDCRRLVLPLIKFAKLDNPHLRSKAVKLMARGNKNPHWADLILSDPNPRVRANLVEEFASQIGATAEPLLRKAARDPNYRVSTAALLALCRLDDQSSREELEKLAVEGDESMRRACAWALGKLEEAIPSTSSPHPTV